MKTAQIIRRLNFAEWGGTESVVWHSVRELNRNGVEIEILATQALGGKTMEKLAGTVQIRRFPYFYPYFPLTAAKRLALDKKGGNPLVPQMEKYLKANNFDLLHSHNLGRLAELAARVAEAQKIPLVLSLHGGCADVPENERLELLRPLKHTLPYGGIVERLFKLRRDALAQATGIICVGANEEMVLKERYPDKLVRHIPNGVDPEKFRKASGAYWRQKLNLSKETKLLLNVSRIDYQKNQKMLIGLLAELRKNQENVHLLLIGPITAKWYAEELKSLAEQKGVSKYMTLIPGLKPDGDELLNAYKEADVFIMPSLHEPFGIVALEAWSANLPVLAAKVGGLQYLVEDKKTGLFFDPKELSTLLAAYHNLPLYRKELAANAALKVEQEYTWEKVGKKLKEFYIEVQNEFRRKNSVCL